MGVFLNRGSLAFESLLNSRIYVDKTDMIGFLNTCVNTEQRYICVSRPRRFGKSVTANMVSAYYDRSCDSRSLFCGRKLSGVSSWDRYLNCFDVIHIDLADIRAATGSSEAALDYMHQKLFEDLSECYGSCGLDEKEDITTWLDSVHQACHTRFVVVIDEWDCLFREDQSNLAVQHRYIDLLRSLFKGNGSRDYLALAYLTGILPIKKYNNESALNNFHEYSMLEPDQLADYIGFTRDEVHALCDLHGMDFDKAMEWYDGYRIGMDCHICGPNSIVQAMDTGVFRNYWSRTVAFDSLKSYITMNFDGLKDAVTLMIGGQRIPVRVNGYNNDLTSFASRDDVLTLLIHLGYLAYDSEKGEIWIPNREVRECFESTASYCGWDE